MSIAPIDIPEKRNVHLSQDFNSFGHLIRVIAYCHKFRYDANPKNLIKSTGPLSDDEVRTAGDCVIKIAQVTTFATEIDCLSRNQEIDRKSKHLNLNPFLDEGILKVGGRLTHSNLLYDEKHPILPPHNHSITRMIIIDAHLELKHAGTQSTLYLVRVKYWPMDGRNTARRIIYNCVQFFKAKPRGAGYKMRNLPANRLEYSRPFLNVGVDFCGPLYIKERRNVNTIMSDNGKYFVGANRELKEIYDIALSGSQSQAVKTYLQKKGIKWNFIPPLSLHFGGLWEAVVKSFKYHLLRTVGNSVLTYEQLETYVVEIEAIFNSRPISPMSSDPNDLRPLTPGHFLIGGPLTSFPQEDLREVKPARLSLWQHAQQMRQHFWCRWHKEYLNELNVRHKWNATSSNIKVGSLAILKEDNLVDTSPMLWPMCRVIEVHPGPDGVVGVVTVKTATGVYKRCVRKLCPLPL
ncbi:uncharacterized protein LOC117180695 [Belonocnema kinseyi]|uniref:uncharacterized protein LOC117180695 n=1 Tax=Belonocnema kinseyi TaxID=2817044 RepID=UPI00143DBD2C|nr:uncharacterized protein LOC117180695 [Belonocnema kinseyi]